ncbi:PUA-like domain-containing protein [Hypoxylon sp. NC1633]|nr:PUA-like domain-containing protein [Hypoxylon sp. NC1633]
MATVEVFAVPDNKEQRHKHIMSQRQQLLLLGLKSRRLGRAATPEDGTHFESLLKKGRLHLQWLDTIEMTPEIKERTSMEQTLKFVYDDDKMFYPDDMKESARSLYEKWESENWGANAVIDEDIASETNETSGPASDEIQIVRSGLPPRDHPVFGVQGIMHGIMIVKGPAGKKTYRLNPRVPKKPAKVFGHNGIPLGAWFANQLVALQRGAHGARIGGIAGTTDAGAYSIVVADNYDDLDNDQGETLYYSGSNSHGNDDPTRPGPSSNGTKALKASLQTRNPVRVLRSGGSASSSGRGWLPACGLRYDGLYRVVALKEPKNANGGLYEQFVLRREPDQTPLEELHRKSPTLQQKRDLEQVQRGY